METQKTRKGQTATDPEDVCSLESLSLILIMSQIHELDVLPCWFGTQIEATTLFEYPASNATISALNIIKSVCTNGVIYRDKDILITGINAAALHLISQRGRSQRMEMSC